jgi:uncharacterized protein (DUF2236 family)
MIPFLTDRLEKMLRERLYGGTIPSVDFTQPLGESALTEPNSVSWKVFNNPVSLFIGGVTAVLLELAEPSVRSGVWDHTTFRTDPMKRMRRTGLAAMVTVYGARGIAESMIAGVRKMHERVTGATPAGIPYHASDPQLLRWVHATAAFGFLEAFHHFVRRVSPQDRDRYFAEGAPIARLYGAENAPTSESELNELFQTTLPRLERSEIVFEFLEIMRTLPLFPRPFGFLNRLLVHAAIDILPAPVRETLGLGTSPRLSPGGRVALRILATTFEILDLKSTPAALARGRLRGR